MSLRAKVMKMIEEGQEFQPEEFNNLLLDEMQIESLSKEDQQFLQEFSELECLSMNSTGMKSLDNFPDNENLMRLELNDNRLSGGELKKLLKYKNLHTLKFANNRVEKIADIEVLRPLETLMNLDLIGNPVCDLEGYKEKMFEIFPKLEILDGYDKNGDEHHSENSEEDLEDEEEEDYGEEFDGDGPEQGDELDDEYDDEEDYGDDYGDQEGDFDDEDEYGDEEED